jgi:hypothetical protein
LNTKLRNMLVNNQFTTKTSELASLKLDVKWGNALNREILNGGSTIHALLVSESIFPMFKLHSRAVKKCTFTTWILILLTVVHILGQKKTFIYIQNSTPTLLHYTTLLQEIVRLVLCYWNSCIYTKFPLRFGEQKIWALNWGKS